MSALSRFINISRIPKSPSQYSSSLTFDPISNHAKFLKKDLESYNFHGLITQSLQYSRPRCNVLVRNSITPSGDPFPSGSPSGSLRNWVVGIMLTFILPFITQKWGPLIQLKNKVDTVMETTEEVMEAIEAVAKGADEIIDEITDDLPQNSKLRETLEAIDEVVEGVVKGAHTANEVIDEITELKENLKAIDEVVEGVAKGAHVANEIIDKVEGTEKKLES